MKHSIKRLSWFVVMASVLGLLAFVIKVSADTVAKTDYTVTTTFKNNGAAVQPNGRYGESKFIITPTFRIADTVDLKNGDVIEYTLPNELEFDTDRTFEIRSDAGTGGVHFATLKVTKASKTAVIEIVDEHFFRQLANNRVITADLTAVWDKTVMPLNTPRQFNLEGYGDITLTRIIIDEEPRGISKWGVQRSDNPSIIEWRIRVNRDLNQMTNVKLVDTIRDGQELVGDIRGHYFKDYYNGPNTAFTTADTTITKTSNKSFEIQLKDLNAEGAFIYYQTRLVDWSTVEAATTNIYNDVTLTRDGADPVVPVTGQAKITTIGGGGTANPDKVIANVKVEWNDANNQDGKRQPVTVKLFADGQDTGKTVTLNEANNWNASFTNLDKETAGRVITYTVVGNDLADYTEGAVTGNLADGFVLPYSRQPETVSYQVTKVWSDGDNQDGKRPTSITVVLFQSVDGAAPTHVLGRTMNLTAVNATSPNVWSASFSDLPKYEAGKLITYSVQEDTAGLPAGYTATVIGQTITNSYTPAEVDQKVTKVWDDANNQDGKRPDAITVQLYKSVAGGPATLVVGKTLELTVANKLDDNTWEAAFTGLPQYEAGQEITYSVKEDDATLALLAPLGYTSQANGMVVTNQKAPETLKISGKKVWSDYSNILRRRPASITVKVKNGSQVVDEITVTEAGNWQFESKDLPKYENGQEIVYTVEEVSVPNYTSTQTKEADGSYTLTNTYRIISNTPSPTPPSSTSSSSSSSTSSSSSADSNGTTQPGTSDSGTGNGQATGRSGQSSDRKGSSTKALPKTGATDNGLELILGLIVLGLGTYTWTSKKRTEG